MLPRALQGTKVLGARGPQSKISLIPRSPFTSSSRISAGSDDAPTSITSEPKLKNVGPEPKRFNVADGALGDVIAASLPTLMRLGSGALVSGYSAGLKEDDGKYSMLKTGGRKLSETSPVLAGFNRPEKPLELYEFEGCPFCKKVREAMSILDLDAYVYPCPKDGATWRPKAIEMGGKKQFPYLVDPNTGVAMYESDDIIRYLFEKYGDGQVPLLLRMGVVTTITCGLGMAARSGKGNKARPSKIPPKPLVFWGYEASPFVKVAREVLSELELPYLYRTAARGSAKRQELLDKVGTFQVPYLEDPNTGSYLFESSAIIKYLNDTYAA